MIDVIPWRRSWQFLSTLSLRRATHYDNYNLHCVEISIHALLAESDKEFRAEHPREALFLSTLSLRRATRVLDGSKSSIEISIHALLAESDSAELRVFQVDKISIHALLAESDINSRTNHIKRNISIHALLAESDRRGAVPVILII